MTGIDRRQFQRIALENDAIAIDKSGRELGKVLQASGGGMLIQPTKADVAKTISAGDHLQVTVLEPGTQTSHTIDVVVRFNDGKQIGIEFLGGKST